MGAASVRPASKPEGTVQSPALKARNVVERTIGILKRRFRVLRTCMDYEMETIKAAIFACIIVHNFVREYNASDIASDLMRPRRSSGIHRGLGADADPIPFDFESGDDWRSWMAGTMWQEYRSFRVEDVLEDELEYATVSDSDDNESIASEDSESSEFCIVDDDAFSCSSNDSYDT